MLTKLLKYEFRSIGRQLIPLYLGVLGLAVVNHFFWFSMPSNRGGLNDALGGVPAMATMMAYIAVIVALGVITLLLIIQRFYKGLLTEEGYLMFTLPCKPWQLIAAKGITAACMTIAASCVGFLSILLMALNLSDWGNFFKGFAKIPWHELFEAHALWPLYIVEFAILCIMALFATVGHIYVSISVGHLSNKHRVACAILAYIGINIAWSTLMVTLANILDMWSWDFRWLDSIGTPAEIHIVMFVMILSQLAPTAVYFFSTNWILSNKLNLE
ncbi:MAG: hypothetical protein HFH27_03910 [Clostridiaceae bacterium]|nr:hypothetical protein [Clostridiaceae bacterium]MCI9483591.1 hypothetical protein [Clostridiaceae bacterium]